MIIYELVTLGLIPQASKLFFGDPMKVNFFGRTKMLSKMTLPTTGTLFSYSDLTEFTVYQKDAPLY